MGVKRTEIEIELTDEEIEDMRAISPFKMNLGTEDDPLWVMCTMLDDDGKEILQMDRAEQGEQ